ncbi:MAG: LON peptidase substrate-binding domain-containing protein, partial [Planctomycetes bacterium]|nr:LON peptidase substrate-binding domain-containing protein [Planctomycetota bacterium]
LLTALQGDDSSDNPGEKVMGVLTQKDSSVDDPDFNNLYTVGTVVAVLKQLRQPDGNKGVVTHGLVRFRIKKWLGSEPYLRARIEVITPEIPPDTKQLQALLTSVRHTALKMVDLSPNIPDEVNMILSNIDEAGALADFLAANINIPAEEKQLLLETLDVTERLQKLSGTLAHQVAMLELSAK